MDFELAAHTVLKELDEAPIDFALIGGIALQAWGVFRGTSDIDLLLLATEAPACHAILIRHLYERIHHTENLSQYVGSVAPLGGFDILHASRAPTRAMLLRAERREVPGLGAFKVALPEDLIGLKLQALRNDPSRDPGDRADIEALLAACQDRGRAVNWEWLREYGRLLGLEALVAQLQAAHG